MRDRQVQLSSGTAADAADVVVAAVALMGVVVRGRAARPMLGLLVALAFRPGIRPGPQVAQVVQGHQAAQVLPLLMERAVAVGVMPA